MLKRESETDDSTARLGTAMAQNAENPEGRPLQRPLLSVLGACLGGTWLADSPLHMGLPLVLLAFLIWRARNKAESTLGPGVPALALFMLMALAGMRTRIAQPAAHAPRIGTWQTRFEGEHLVGILKGHPQRFELPLGSVRDGERVQLLVMNNAGQPAMGWVPSSGDNRWRGLIKVQADEVRRLERAPGGGWIPGSGLWRDLRQAASARLESIEDPSTRGLAAALMFGDRSQLVPGTADLYTRTGTRHALAVSGLHVGLVAGLWIWPLGTALAWILRRLPGLPKSWRQHIRVEALRIMMLLAFIPLAGAGAPVIRAALALSLIQLTELLPARDGGRWRHMPDGLSIWAFAALLEWCVDNQAFHSISMQLSYVATLGLILLTRPTFQFLRGHLPGAGIVSPVWSSGQPRSPWFKLFAQKGLDWLVGGLAASFAASAATLPIVWYRFGEWSWVGPFATLWLLPWLALFMGFAWFQLLLPNALCAFSMQLITRTMETGLEWFDGWPGTPTVLPLRPWLLLACAGASLLIAAAARGPWAVRARRVSALSWGLTILPWCNATDHVELYLADVGNGTAAVVRLPGAGTWIFDAGSRNRSGVAREAVAPLLRWLDPEQVNVALSHAEADHAGALPWLIERFVPERWLGALPARLQARLPLATQHLDLESGRLELALGQGAQAAQLTLIRGQLGDGNEGSRSLEVRAGAQRWLLCGDAEGPGLAKQLRAGLLRGPYDLVLFPHHGSETPWLAEFLDATTPGHVWFSCSGRPPVADELDRRGIPWSSTADNGPLRWRTKI